MLMLPELISARFGVRVADHQFEDDMK
jgi:hypothetical protein